MKNIKRILMIIMCCILLISTVMIPVNAAKTGDLNGDNKVNSADALLVLQYSTGLVPFDENQQIIADINNDNKISSADALVVLQIAVGAVIPDESTPSPSTKADIVKFFNTETAKAAKGSYNLERTGKFVKDIDVGSATNALNTLIKNVDANSDLNSIVGTFIGVSSKPVTGTVKNGNCENCDVKYMIKAMNLKEADIKSFRIDGNKYTIEINDCTNPGINSALEHATNDYVTFSEANKNISEQVGNAVQIVEGESKIIYKDIVFVATIIDGKITDLRYSYLIDANIKIKLAIINTTGTGAAAISCNYTDIKY